MIPAYRNLETYPSLVLLAMTLVVALLGSPVVVLGQSCAYEWSDAFNAGDFDDWVWAIAFFDDGTGSKLFVGGSFDTAGGVPAKGIACLVDDQWIPLGDGLGDYSASAVVYDFAVFDDGSGPALYAGGIFSSIDGVPAIGIARWDGGRWNDVGGGLASGWVRRLSVFDDGNGPALYAAGSFDTIGGTGAANIAKWDGSVWAPVGGGLTGAFANVTETAVLDLGAGARLYAGGSFSTTGGTAAPRVASWDGSTWSDLGTEFDGQVAALDAFDDGGGMDLYAGGAFTDAGGAPALNVARWDGTTWTSVAGGIETSGVNSLVIFDDGGGADLYACHGAADINGDNVGFQRLEGAGWIPVPGGPNSNVNTAMVRPAQSGNPRLVVGGSFTAVDGDSASRLAIWDGQNWGTVQSDDAGNGLSSSSRDVAAANLGAGPRVYVAGDFVNAGSTRVNFVACWDGSTWQPLGDGLSSSAQAVATFDPGSGDELYVGGMFAEAGGATSPAIARWDGTSWSSVGGGLSYISGGNPSVDDMIVFDSGSGDALYVSGGFDQAGGVSVNSFAMWDGTSWSDVGGGPGVGADGDMVVFDDGGGEALYVPGDSRVVKWDGASWSDVGPSFNSFVAGLAVFDDGTGSALYAAGYFTDVGGQGVQYLARWNGASWIEVPGVESAVQAIAAFDEGQGERLFVMSTFGAPVISGIPENIVRWDGTRWSGVRGGTAGLNFLTKLEALDPDGAGPESPSLWLTGQFTSAGGQSSGNIARWQFDRTPVQYVRIDFGEVSVPVTKTSNAVLREDGSTLMTLDKGARAGFDPQDLGYPMGTDRAGLIRSILATVHSDYMTADGEHLDVCFDTTSQVDTHSTVSVVQGTYPDMVVANNVPGVEMRVEAATARLALTSGAVSGYYVLLEDGRLRRPDDSLVPGVSFPEVKRIRVDAFGSAQMLDKGNADKNKNAWVFVGEHTRSADPDENLRELANSISHEIAHLLGLEHADGETDSILGQLSTYGDDKEFSDSAREKLAGLLPPGGVAVGGLRGSGLRVRQAKIGDSDQFGTSAPGTLTGVLDTDAAAIMREARLLLEPQATHDRQFEFDLVDVTQADAEDGLFTDIALSNGSTVTYSLDLLESGVDGNFVGAYVEIALLNVADVLGAASDFAVLVEGVEILGALDGVDQRITDPEFIDYACGERFTFFLQDHLTIPQIEAALADGVLDVSVEVRGATPYVVVDSVLAIVTDRGPQALTECGPGTVNLGGGTRTDVLQINGTAGGELRTVRTPGGEAIRVAIDLPPGGGAGRFVVHMNLGQPGEATMDRLPAGLGIGCFPMLLPSATPVAVWSNLGESELTAMGSSHYFGGPVPNAGLPGANVLPPAPFTFLSLPGGDPVKLPVGTTLTLQGLIDDPNSLSPRGLSVTNAVALSVVE